MSNYHEREISKSLNRIAYALEAMLTEEQRAESLRRQKEDTDALLNMLKHQMEAEKIIRAEKEA